MVPLQTMRLNNTAGAKIRLPAHLQARSLACDIVSIIMVHWSSLNDTDSVKVWPHGQFNTFLITLSPLFISVLTSCIFHIHHDSYACYRFSFELNNIHAVTPGTKPRFLQCLSAKFCTLRKFNIRFFLSLRFSPHVVMQ